MITHFPALNPVVWLFSELFSCPWYLFKQVKLKLVNWPAPESSETLLLLIHKRSGRCLSFWLGTCSRNPWTCLNLFCAHVRFLVCWFGRSLTVVWCLWSSNDDIPIELIVATEIAVSRLLRKLFVETSLDSYIDWASVVSATLLTRSALVESTGALAPRHELP